tara:strand:- start:29 stop:538 length:510 start_codon:yes stop_codon:yes gene_type:complete
MEEWLFLEKTLLSSPIKNHPYHLLDSARLLLQDPYAEYPSLRAVGEALYCAVAEKGTRPTIPPTCPPPMAALIRRCWHGEPNMRPFASELIKEVEALQKEYNINEEEWENAIVYHDSDDPDYDSDDTDDSSSDSSDDDDDDSSEEGGGGSDASGSGSDRDSDDSDLDSE